MYTYRNSKGATITTACEITGGGWEPVVRKTEAMPETRDGEVKESKPKRKRNE